MQDQDEDGVREADKDAEGQEEETPGERVWNGGMLTRERSRCLG